MTHCSIPTRGIIEFYTEHGTVEGSIRKTKRGAQGRRDRGITQHRQRKGQADAETNRNRPAWQPDALPVRQGGHQRRQEFGKRSGAQHARHLAQALRDCEAGRQIRPDRPQQRQRRVPRRQPDIAAGRAAKRLQRGGGRIYAAVQTRRKRCPGNHREEGQDCARRQGCAEDARQGRQAVAQRTLRRQGATAQGAARKTSTSRRSILPRTPRSTCATRPAARSKRWCAAIPTSTYPPRSTRTRSLPRSCARPWGWGRWRCSSNRTTSPRSWSTTGTVFISKRPQDNQNPVPVHRQRAGAFDNPPHHRAHRPPHRREFADGRRAPARRQPRQRDHPPAEPDGADADDTKFSRDPFKMSDLVAFGSLSREMGEFLEFCVRYKRNCLVSGGTGSGKTHAAQCVVAGDTARRAHNHDRRLRRTQTQPGARNLARGQAAQHRGQGRDTYPQTGDKQPSHEARQDYRGRVPRVGGAGHAPGDEHRPRRLADDGALQQRA